MKCAGLLAELVYRAVPPAACVASPLLPESLHPGERAQRSIREMGAAPGHARFARELLISAGRSYLLQRHMSKLTADALAAFIGRNVDHDGAIDPDTLLEERRPLIFATPHYGAMMVGCVAVAHLLRPRKALNLFFDKKRHGSKLGAFFERAGMPPATLLGGLAGIRSALRALERGESLAILPDAFDDIDRTLVVPFFGRMLRVASGTASLALRSRALIVPSFATPRRDFGVRITFGAPIDACRVQADDEQQAIFTVTHLLFSRIEAQLRLAPQHWRYWEMLPHVSTPLDALAGLDDAQLLRTLKSRFHALPEAVQDIPELELLLE